VFDFNPYSRRLHADPYPTYERLRSEFPIYFNAKHRFWALSRYADVLEALKDWQTFGSGQGITVQSFSGLKPMIILMDPPRQTELRAILLRAFTPRRIAALEERIRAIARDLIGDFVDAGSCDFVRAFSAPYPTTVIAELLGIDPGDRETFKHWSDQIMTSQSPDADSLKDAYGQIFDYFSEIIARRRVRPTDDLVSALVAAEAEGRRLTEDELLGFCALLLIAGNETMANFLSNAMLTLHRQPEIRKELASDASLFPGAVEELLRFEPPVHELGRTLTRDVELDGQTLRSGDRVLLLLASANRDSSEFPNPDRLDVRRSPNGHLSFGFGIHFCMGASLARLEARVALEELLKSIPDYAVTADEIQWFRTPSVRGPASLPIAFGGR
jgi:cytochrome P450